MVKIMRELKLMRERSARTLIQAFSQIFFWHFSFQKYLQKLGDEICSNIDHHPGGSNQNDSSTLITGPRDLLASRLFFVQPNSAHSLRSTSISAHRP